MKLNASSHFVSFDLEVGKGKDKRIHAIGAVRSDTGESLTLSGVNAAQRLGELDRFADGASFVLGHNIVAFDMPLLEAANPGLTLLRLPVIDTLRLSPLAFPRNPYHKLVKHYQDGGLVRGQINNPELDSRLALNVFDEQCQMLEKTDKDLLASWHWLCTPKHSEIDSALDDLFSKLRNANRPTKEEAIATVKRRLDDLACMTQAQQMLNRVEELNWSLSYILAWLSVAGDGCNSVVPPWVRHQFPDVGNELKKLRDTACSHPDCTWCRTHHDATKELKNWFGFDQYRPKPETKDGRSIQKAIVDDAMAGKHVLGILPTGTGKSVCYQVPALSRYTKTGALTVVISPLVALMADQVAGLEAKGIDCCVTINGLLSMPERAHNLDRVRLGEAGILLISPEQLRSRTLRSTLEQREIGAWILDEAHCLSRWGHDFRPDYLYVGRFIREQAGKEPIPPILCLTATAKPDVIDDITDHFRKQLGIKLAVYNGGTDRTNLEFEVIRTSTAEKFGHIHQNLDINLPAESSGGAIIYCATRKQTEEVAEYLSTKKVNASYFHAGLSPERKKNVQKRFIEGDLRVITATNAFGMGIDKPDVRLVIHADITGSLENYLQEAGRAGRDREPARCVLFYTDKDVERQFSMSAYSRLSLRDIHGILRALRNLDRKERFQGNIVATSGEILSEDDENHFERDSATDDTRVRTAVAWLEESKILTREENFVTIFPSSLRVDSCNEAKARLTKAGITANYRNQLLNIATAMIEADADEGISTDKLMGVSGLSAEGVRTALYDLERLGIASNDTVLTAFVHAGIKQSSKNRLTEATILEKKLINCMREQAPDLSKGETSSLILRVAAQIMRDKGVTDPFPERLYRIIRSISHDGKGEADGAVGSFSVYKPDTETVRITLNRNWKELEITANLRREAANCVLDHLLGCLPQGVRGLDLLAETTLGNLLHVIQSDLSLKSKVRYPNKLLDRALLWLHEQEVIRLNKGLAVFRPAMTIKMDTRERRWFKKEDFAPLQDHYDGQIRQIHVMEEYATKGLDSMRVARSLAFDYFQLNENEFLEKWLPGKEKEVRRQTTFESWRTIVDKLDNPVQQNIVTDEREATNVLVLAGPGSGKTRVLVHRIAWLVRVRRENPRGILALTYNRHAAVDIRRRLKELIGNDGLGITVLTCHAFAMRLAGASFDGRSDQLSEKSFQEVMRQAIDLLTGQGRLPEEIDELRSRLLSGFRWILVDEYQDIGPEQYELISAIAGRQLNDDESKLTLFAVGDDDQNIYSFRGASVQYIRQFQDDYGPNLKYLTSNYRSTRNIIEASNAIIEPAHNRMKAENTIEVNATRAKDLPGGKWTKTDPVSQGQVQLLPAGTSRVDQARHVIAELVRLSKLSNDWCWSRCAIIGREWKDLRPLRACCELHPQAKKIQAQMADENIPGFWQLRETQAFIRWIQSRRRKLFGTEFLRSWVDEQSDNPWIDLICQAINEHAEETGGQEIPANHFFQWLAEWGREIRRNQQGLLLLTAHRAKGLEFDHVVILDGEWSRFDPSKEDPDAPRRLYYVAMTRARQTLTLACMKNSSSFHNLLVDHPSTILRQAPILPPCPIEATYHHLRPSPKEVDLGFAGRRHPECRIHQAIAGLSIDDPLDVQVKSNGKWILLDREGHAVGGLAKSFEPPAGTLFKSAKVYAIISRTQEMSDPACHCPPRCDQWEVVFPELVFEPTGAANR